jgi:hypothetical protein
MKDDLNVGFSPDPGLGSRVRGAGLRTTEEAAGPQRPGFHGGIGVAGANAGTEAT